MLSKSPCTQQKDIPLKIHFLFIAATSIAAVAGPFKVSAEANLGLAQPLVGSNFDSQNDATIHPSGTSGLGFSIGPVVEYAITPTFGIKGGIAYAWQNWTVKENGYQILAYDTLFASDKVDIKMSTLEFSIGPTIRINEKFSAGIGYRWSIPLGGTASESGNATKSGKSYSISESQGIKWAGSSPDTSRADMLSSHSIYLQAGYEVMPHLTVGLDVTIGLTGLIPKLNADNTSYDGAYSRSSNIVLNRYALNVRYDFL